MWIEDYQWHYDYVRLAWDTGFSFEKCKSPNLDKNKICVVDVDRIVKERDVASVDRYIATVVQYILDDEQAKVLDTNFVKIFRISQLAVEYLLFCKKYLDNTVVLLKKELTKNREEIKELKVFIEDLQTHVETLTRQQAFATFKCSFCSKVFSSEEYLNAHIKRRHNNQSTESYNSETDKLNLEIKELKERLNITEKLLKEKDTQSLEKNLLDLNNDKTRVGVVLEKFEAFKNQVDNELKELKIQKSFYEENYGKLFDIVIQNKENVEPKNQIKEVPKAETTTQTDKLLHLENVNAKNVLEIKELSTSGSDDKNEIISPELQKDSLEARISTTLSGIEGQMLAFWNKLNELEQNKPNVNLQPTLPFQIGDNVMKEIKPRAKPRSKFSKPTHNTSKISNNTERLKIAIEELESQQKEEQARHREIVIIHNEKASSELKRLINIESQSPGGGNLIEGSHPEQKSISVSEYSESESGSEVSAENKIFFNAPKASLEKHVGRRMSESSDSSRHDMEKVVVKPSLRSVGKKSNSSLRKRSSRKAITNLSKEIDAIVCNQLQELGISESWSRLPEKSFDKALEIINHQAGLTKKAYPHFNSIKKKLNGDIERQCNKISNSKTKLEIGSNTSKLEKIQNIVKVSYRPKSGRKNIDQRNSITSPMKEAVEIKNRALYDTDTESEPNFKQSRANTVTGANMADSHRWYSNVIEEFNAISDVKAQTDEDSMDEANKDAQKGVLKSFPSVGSLSKKKVLFDLESESSKMEDAPVIQKTGGSTTSIASSILGDKIDTTKDEGNDKEKSNIKHPEKDLDDLSDFDL